MLPDLLPKWPPRRGGGASERRAQNKHHVLTVVVFHESAWPVLTMPEESPKTQTQSPISRGFACAHTAPQQTPTAHFRMRTWVVASSDSTSATRKCQVCVYRAGGCCGVGAQAAFKRHTLNGCIHWRVILPFAVWFVLIGPLWVCWTRTAKCVDATSTGSCGLWSAAWVVKRVSRRGGKPKTVLRMSWWTVSTPLRSVVWRATRCCSVVVLSLRNLPLKHPPGLLPTAVSRGGSLARCPMSFGSGSKPTQSELKLAPLRMIWIHCLFLMPGKGYAALSYTGSLVTARHTVGYSRGTELCYHKVDQEDVEGLYRLIGLSAPEEHG